MKATVFAKFFALRSPWVSTTSFLMHINLLKKEKTKLADNGWHTPYDSPSAPPCLLSTPQSSWQPCSNSNTAQGSWVFRRHIFKQPDEPAAVKPVSLGPPGEPAPSKPKVLEIVHHTQSVYSWNPGPRRGKPRAIASRDGKHRLPIVRRRNSPYDQK